MNTSAPPAWLHCAHGADPATNPVGCRGICVPGYTDCLAHLASADRDTYLAGLTPGTSVDHRGTPFTHSLLSALLNALRDPATSDVRLGDAYFESAIFQDVAVFGSAIFEGRATFDAATFEDGALFQWVTFKGEAEFESATFKSTASFESAIFQRLAKFKLATFQGEADFESATFERRAWFGSAAFMSTATFHSATFQSETQFGSAAFISTATFQSATFQGEAWFGAATFEAAAGFASATFEGRAWFESATFKGEAGFGSATFKYYAWFDSALFGGDAYFVWATFEGATWFGQATFKGDAWFGSVNFEGTIANFGAAVFEGNAGFASATFARADTLGPLVCAGRVILSVAKFGGPVTLSIATRHLVCRRTRWSSTAEIRLRYATVDLAHAVFEYPLTVAAEAEPFILPSGEQLTGEPIPGEPEDVRVASLRGVDAAHLILADVDLPRCLFTGTVHLDQLRLEGACTFDAAPPKVHWQRWLPVRFTERRVLAEEHHWRASQPGAVRGWNVAVFGAGRVGPLQLAPVYRALRKAHEDGKHEPGAADFYYGEMEMRRHADDIPRTEKWLLAAYWALSGYGLRASRALAWLGATMLLTVILMMAFGIAQDDPKQTAKGTVPAGGGKVTFEIEKDDPQNPSGDRFTGERFEKALNITLNSVVFRSSSQDLTTAGTYIEMASRVSEPVLLGLGVLAIRNRVKR